MEIKTKNSAKVIEIFASEIIASNLTIAYFIHLQSGIDPKRCIEDITDKFSSFSELMLNYRNVSKKIGVEIYDYNFTVINPTKDVVYNFGLNPTNPDNLIKIKRVGILGGEIVTVDVMVWLWERDSSSL